LNGGEIVGVEKEDLIDAEQFSKMLTDNKIKLCVVSTSLFNLLINQKINTFANVHTVLFGAESAAANHVRNTLVALDGKAAPKRLVNVYGPTENSVLSTFFHVKSPDMFTSNVPVGIPISNSTVHILDAFQRPVPIGITGELYVGGPGVADGYLNQEEKTRELFIADPFDSTDDAMLYRTGDVGRFRDDGNIELLGRIDDQVKIRGYRIELGEVESNLKAIEGVCDSCVLLKEDKTGDKKLVAYIVPSTGIELTPNTLKSEMKKRVPDSMVPSAYVVLGQFLRTANGKVNKRALPLPDDSCYESNDYVEPKNSIERQLKGIWQAVLPLENISTNSDFFELGGHSLHVTRVASKVRAEMGVDLSIRTLFEATTISALADVIANSAQSLESVNEAERGYEEVTL